MMPKSPYRRHRLAPLMSAHHILGLEQVLGRFGCSPIKVVRELGSGTSRDSSGPYLPWV